MDEATLLITGNVLRPVRIDPARDQDRQPIPNSRDGGKVDIITDDGGTVVKLSEAQLGSLERSLLPGSLVLWLVRPRHWEMRNGDRANSGVSFSLVRPVTTADLDQLQAQLEALTAAPAK